MSFRVEYEPGEKCYLVFSEEPEYIRAINSPIDFGDKDYKSGIWIIVAFSIWNGTHRPIVSDVMAYAKSFGGKVILGVRPYDFPEDIGDWQTINTTLPKEKHEITTFVDQGMNVVHIAPDPESKPLWLIINNGNVVRSGTGKIAPGELDFIENI